MPKITGPSGWTFKTSGGVGLSVLWGSVEGGHLVLTAPGGGGVVFNYAAAGVGLSYGGPVTVTGSTEDMTSVGKIFLLEGFHGQDLTIHDFEGLCVILEASVGIGAGNTGTVMFLGIPLASKVAKSWAKRYGMDLIMGPAYKAGRKVYGFLKSLFSKSVPVIDPLELAGHAKAVLLMDGFNRTAIASIGVTSSYGYLWTGSVSPWGEIKIPYDTDQEVIGIRSTSTSKDTSIITFDGDVLFDFDKSDLKSTARIGLLLIGAYIKLTSPRTVLIDGHTDSKHPKVNGPEYNMALSWRRANAVKGFLVSNKFVNARMVETKGHGETMPVAPNTLRMPFGPEIDNPDGRALNRRVEIKLLDY